MKKLLLLPTMLFPYMVCLSLGYGFIAQSFSNITFKALDIISLVTLALSFVCNFIYIFSTRKKTAELLLKNAFLIKAIHIPTYIFILALGIMMGLMFFITFPFILILIVFDLLTLWISGMISVYSIAKSFKASGLCSKSLLIIAMICQFFFCADIISLFVVKIVIKKKKFSQKANI